LAWIEAFDQIRLTVLQSMRSLDLFSEQGLPAHFSDVLPRCPRGDQGRQRAAGAADNGVNGYRSLTAVRCG
jgi:hypothetical protein